LNGIDRPDQTKNIDNEWHEAAAVVACNHPMPTHRDLTKDDDNNELNEAEEEDEEEASHDPMPTDGASTRAHILPVGDSKRTQPYWYHLAKQIVTMKRQPTSHTTIWNLR
jgi:hypothetical protein